MGGSFNTRAFIHTYGAAVVHLARRGFLLAGFVLPLLLLVISAQTSLVIVSLALAIICQRAIALMPEELTGGSLGLNLGVVTERAHGYYAMLLILVIALLTASWLARSRLGKALKAHFHEEFQKALGQSERFSVVDESGPDVLLISGHIVNLKIAVPPMRDQEPDETDYTASSGQMTLILEARDSKSGEALVRVGEARAIQMSDGGFYESNPVANSAAVRRIFRDWASDLRRELDQFHALPELPAASTPAPK